MMLTMQRVAQYIHHLPDQRIQVPVTRSSLVQWGKSARELGVCKRVDEVLYTFTKSSILVPPDFDDKTWRQFENTLDVTLRQGFANPTEYPAWDRNSCWLDALVMELLAHGVFYRQADQLPLEKFKALSVPAAALRMTLTSGWHDRTWIKGNRQAYQLLRELLAAANSQLPTTGMADVNEAAHCACNDGGIPTRTTVTANTKLCCDDTTRYFTTQQTPRALWGVGLCDTAQDVRTVATAFNELFTSDRDRDNRNPNTGEMLSVYPPCSKGADCLQLYQAQTVVLERLSPELSLVFEGGAALAHKGRDWFANLTVDHVVLGKGPDGAYQYRHVVSIYEPISITTLSGGHFTVVACQVGEHPKEQLFKLDAMARPPKQRLEGDWWSAWQCPDEVRVVGMVYRLKQRRIKK